MSAKHTRFVVLCGYVTGGGDYPLTIDYSWDGRTFASRIHAIKHGFKSRGSDDFNIGVIEGHKLVSLEWMDEVVDSDPDALAEIAESACLSILEAEGR